MLRRTFLQHFIPWIPGQEPRKPVEGARLVKVLGADAWLVGSQWPLPRWVNLGDAYSDTMQPVSGSVLAEVS